MQDQSPPSQNVVSTNPKKPERGDFEFFQDFLTEELTARIRRVQIFTIARMIESVAQAQHEIQILNQTEAGTW